VKFLVIFIFVVFLVQFCVILVRNGMFYVKTKSSNLVIVFYYVIDTMYIYSWKEWKNWPILVILYVKSSIFLSHMVFNLTMEWTPRPPWVRPDSCNLKMIRMCKKIIQMWSVQCHMSPCHSLSVYIYIYIYCQFKSQNLKAPIGTFAFTLKFSTIFLDVHTTEI